MTSRKQFFKRESHWQLKKKLNCLTRIRVLSGDQIALGPGKVTLLEEIERSGSISKAARTLGLSYRRAWTLVDTMNKSFESYLVRGSAGGKRGGGASLTPLGAKMVKAFRAMEIKAEKAIQVNWKTIKRSLKQTD